MIRKVKNIKKLQINVFRGDLKKCKFCDIQQKGRRGVSLWQALKVCSGEIYIMNIMPLLSFERWIEHQQTFQIKKIDDPWCI